jgi:hypothetical protein
MTALPLKENGIVAAPHIVILGAGASIAAYNHWGKIGAALPSMQDLAAVLDLRDDIVGAGFDPDAIGFEELYDTLASTKSHPQLQQLIEDRVLQYFSALSLPDAPTIYDYLILALREKDVIATFNWDPFLLQAYLRNEIASKDRRPALAFLHGNVKQGVCFRDSVKGLIGDKCSRCNEAFSPSKLLYPVKQKDYATDKLIENEWLVLRNKLAYGYYLTIFGYGAPKTDVEARELILKDWTDNPTLRLAQVDIVDIKPREELEDNWKEFFVSHHYGITDDIFSSHLFLHPRRSCDALEAATLLLSPWYTNPFPKFDSLVELQNWVATLIEEEERQARDGKPFSGDPTAPNKKK